MEIREIIEYYGGRASFAQKFKLSLRTSYYWHKTNKCPAIIIALFGYFMPTDQQPNKIRAELRDVERFYGLRKGG